MHDYFCLSFSTSTLSNRVLSGQVDPHVACKTSSMSVADTASALRNAFLFYATDVGLCSVPQRYCVAPGGTIGGEELPGVGLWVML